MKLDAGIGMFPPEPRVMGMGAMGRGETHSYVYPIGPGSGRVRVPAAWRVERPSRGHTGG